MTEMLGDHFDYLDSLDEVSSKKENCCENKDNMNIEGSIISCKVCSNTIYNICDNPEWRFYGNTSSNTSDPTRCGMPMNTLLPESSIGS